MEAAVAPANLPNSIVLFDNLIKGCTEEAKQKEEEEKLLREQLLQLQRRSEQEERERRRKEKEEELLKKSICERLNAVNRSKLDLEKNLAAVSRLLSKEDRSAKENVAADPDAPPEKNTVSIVRTARMPESDLRRLVTVAESEIGKAFDSREAPAAVVVVAPPSVDAAAKLPPWNAETAERRRATLELVANYVQAKETAEKRYATRLKDMLVGAYAPATLVNSKWLREKNVTLRDLLQILKIPFTDLANAAIVNISEEDAQGNKRSDKTIADFINLQFELSDLKIDAELFVPCHVGLLATGVVRWIADQITTKKAIDCGFSYIELECLNFRIADSFEGVSFADLKKTGFSSSDWLNLGFGQKSLQELKIENEAHLRECNLNPKELQQAFGEPLRYYGKAPPPPATKPNGPFKTFVKF